MDTGLDALDLPTDLRKAIQEAHHALTGLLVGDAEPARKTYSHGEHVTLFGAYGGYDTGWPALSRRLDAIAPLVTSVGQGSHVAVHTLSAQASGALAYTVELERHVHSEPGHSPQETTQTLRVTQIYRLIQGQWKLVHRHADPLSEIDSTLAETGWSQTSSS